jgi:tetratricopeptide (TPR) repeat protein
VAGKYKLAINNLEKAVAVEPTYYPSAYRLLGYSYTKMENYEKAMKNMDIFFNLNKDKKQNILSTDYISYGDILINTGKDSLGIIYYYKAMDMDTSLDYYKSIADLYNKQKKYTKAAETMEQRITYTTKKLRLEPADYFYIGKYYYNASKYVKADTAFARYNRYIPDQPGCLLYRALIHNSLDDSTSTTGAAGPYFQAFIDKAANNPDYKDNIPMAYTYFATVAYNKKDNDKADEWFKKILDTTDPANEATKDYYENAKQFHEYLEKLKKQKSAPQKTAPSKTKGK